MTNKELKAKALESMNGKWGTAVALTVFKAAFILVFIIFEALIWLVLNHLNIEYGYSVSYMIGTHLGRFMTVMRLLLLVFVFSPENYILKRLFIDLYSGRNFIETRRYIQYNSRTVHPKATASHAVPMMLKFFVSVPLYVGIYGIYYWGWQHRSDSLTTAGLFVFMLSIAFTIVWLGVFIHYCISLSMTSYIMLLNPRANIFDACDLSVRIMDGQHMRYFMFVLSFAKYLPLMVFFYPIFILDPYYKMCHCVLARDILGNYWQDKFPAMIQRWNKYAR